MKGPQKPDKDNPGDPIGATNGDTVWKLFLAVVFGTAITVVFIVIDRVTIATPPDGIEIQELRQNIADLQNRVYELENE